MSHDQTNTFEIFRVEPCAEAETKTASDLAAVTILAEDPTACHLLIHDEEAGLYRLVEQGLSDGMYRYVILRPSGAGVILSD